MRCGRSDLLILTGGLGPTDDDLTRDVVADLIGRPLEYHAHIFEAIEQRFTARGLRTPEINRRQAMVPRGRGGAAEQERNGARPVDRARAKADRAAARSAARAEADVRGRHPGATARARRARRGCSGGVLRITGQSESSVEEKMQPLYAKWLAAPTKITTTILASLGQIELHLTAIAPNCRGRASRARRSGGRGARGARPRSVQHERRDDAAGRRGAAARARVAGLRPPSRARADS